jgi:hypothetical protein
MSTEQVRMEAPDTSSAADEANAAPLNQSTETVESLPKGSEPNLGEEFREFGKQIEGLFQTARTSPRGKEIQQQLTAAWRDVERGINNTFSSAQTADIKGTVTGTAQYAADELQGGLARGLHNLNLWMAQKAQEAEERRKKREAEISTTATMGTADNEVQDRFSGSEEPAIGEGLEVPIPTVRVTPIQVEQEDRFDDNPPTI